MRKSVLFLVLMLSVSTIMKSCSDARGSKPNDKEKPKIVVESNYINSLKEAGFERLPLLTTMENENLRAEYKKKYGLDFIANSEMNELLKSNDLMMAESRFYTGEIPEQALKAFGENYKNCKTIGIPTGWNFHNKFYSDEWMETEGNKYEIKALILEWGERMGNVFVVGPSSKFDKEAIEAEKRGKDPIIIIKVEKGFLELARW